MILLSIGICPFYKPDQVMGVKLLCIEHLQKDYSLFCCKGGLNS